MKKWKTGLLFTFVLILTLSLTACGGTSSSKTNSGSSAGDSGKAASSDSGNKEILLWSGTTGPDGELIQKNIDKYNATNPEYKVKLVSMEGSVLNNKLATVTRSGKGVPDIALIASENISVYESQGMLDNWDDYINGSKVSSENYVKAAWDVGTVDGKQYGVPASMGTWVMYYNKDLVDKYAPGAADDNIITYEEIEKAGAAAKKDGIYSYGFSWGMQNFNNLYMQMGGKFAQDGKPTIDNDTAAATMNEFKKLYDQGYMNKNGEDTTKLFTNGKIIFMPEGTWMLSTMNKITNFKWAETFTPQWDASHIVQCSGADQFAMFKSKERSDDKIKATVKFFEWLQGNQTDWISSGANPASLSMLNNSEYSKMPQSFLLKTDEGRQAITIITDPGASYIFSEIDSSAWDMIQGKVAVKDQLAKIQKTVNDKMNQ